MEILYIKLKNGTDIISNTSIEGNDVTLENPMAIRQYADPTGRILLSFQEWVPSDFVETSSFVISKEETIVISSTSLRTKEFYKECLQRMKRVIWIQITMMRKTKKHQMHIQVSSS